MSDFELTKIELSVKTVEDKRHDFTNVHHGYLTSRGIVSDDWEVKGMKTTPSFFSIEYGNGIRLFGDEQTFRIAQVGDLRSGEESVALGLIVKYLASVSPDVFRAAWAEIEMEISQENSSEWVAKRFVCPGVISPSWNNVQTMLVFGFLVEGLLVHSTCTGGRRAGSQNDDGRIYVSGHFGRDQFSSDSELIRWWSEWIKHEDVVLTNLASLMGIEDDNA